MELVDGTLALWDTAGGRTTNLARLPTPARPYEASRIFVPPGGLALSGNRVAVLVLGDNLQTWSLIVFDITTGAGSVVSQSASPYGVTMKGDLLIWADNVGEQANKLIGASERKSMDTDLEAYSFATGNFYRLFPEPGQQGYPDFDGERLVWQDSILGGNDIFTIKLPQGL
jgi:hypothetical protein